MENPFMTDGDIVDAVSYTHLDVYKRQVLLALVDANSEFLVVEAGANGRVTDGGVLSNSTF